ncbi:hypothetical protein ET475_16360 [Microbacterium protaetiae]|uniref:FHA domain-containing protein n=1 Tax=Microbacterium protaetiae TaxID=2509458 RepID=A0A4V0YDP1_9MICO|nr:FHA domain-containing protein [Microbacterium protaetiae]QAY61391.1 hypothetical protein ET475_16360 [Microbacterium protaetiae]
MSHPTTTHAEWGAGNPRLIVSREDRHHEEELRGELITIGSAADADIRLEGVDPIAGEIRHDDRDEFVFVPHAAGETNARLQPMSTAEGQDGEVLRTGARFTLGDWTFVFMREEFADHGRPYGGREGGEGQTQPEQPERPDYSDGHPAEDAPE